MQTQGITPDSVFVVSGGARGITARCVIRMAEHYGCRFLLLGRSAHHVPEAAAVPTDTDERGLKQHLSQHLLAQGEKPTPARVQQLARAIIAAREITVTLQAVQQAGGHAEYIAVDVTDRAALLAALAPHPTITGIIHGAGTLADRLIEKKTPADFEQVYRVKIDGLANLLAAVPPERLHYLVLFGSVAGFYGNVGQADYAIANEIFNKTAHMLRRTHPHCHVITINWGPWDGGMVTPALKEHFARHNIRVIPAADGANMLIRELEAHRVGAAAPEVVIGDPIRIPAAPSNGTPREYRIERRLTLHDNPFLLDHIIGENPVLPAVFGVAWIANICEQLYPSYRFFRSHDFRVLKGIVFNAEELADSYTLDLHETGRNDNDIAFEGLIWSRTSDGRQRFNYRGQFTLVRELPAPPVYDRLDLRETHPLDGNALYADGTLFHGPSLQGVERALNLSETHVTVRCHAPPIPRTIQGQFRLQTFHPYLTDIQFQCMLIWVRHFHQAGGMPLGAREMFQYRDIPTDGPFYVSMDVEEGNDIKLIATVTVHDEQGVMYMQVRGTQVAISTRLNSMFARAREVMAAHRSE